MTAPSTPLEVVQHLGTLTKQLVDRVKALQDAEVDAAKQRHAANMAESRAFLNADGAMDLRRHLAKASADVLEGEALVAEAVVRGLRHELRALETRIDVGRTFGATVRAELKTLGYGPDA